MTGLWKIYWAGNVLVVDRRYNIKQKIIQRGVGGIITETDYQTAQATGTEIILGLHLNRRIQ